MIAAMRPSHAYQSTSSVHSRPSSRNSNHSSVSAAASTPSKAKSEKLAVKAANNVASGVSGKKASAAKKVAKAHEQAIEPDSDNKPAQTPGLITLTKPLSQEMQASKSSNSQTNANATKTKKMKETKFLQSDSPAGTPTKNAKSKKSKSPRYAEPSENLLSKSAPSAPTEHAFPTSKAKVQNGGSNAAAATTTEGSGLTWQQEMFKLSSKSHVDLSGHGKKAGRKAQHANSKHDGNLAQPQKVQGEQDSSALTWQQELLGAKKRAGPHFDVFADSRDAETFGSGDASANNAYHGSQGKGTGGKRRPRTGSFGSGGPKSGNAQGKIRSSDVPLHIDDLFDSPLPNKHHHMPHNVYPAHGAPIHIDPSTPAKKIPGAGHQQQHPAVAAAIAYAGPNFHNSPSPASLPAPKFQNRMARNGGNAEGRSSSLAPNGSSGESSGGSDEEYELNRGVRSTTAPAQIATPSKTPAATSPPTGVPANQVNSDSPAPKPTMQPGATVESLLARMMGGARLN